MIGQILFWCISRKMTGYRERIFMKTLHSKQPKRAMISCEKAYIEEAMSKSGKIDEKLQALKDVSKKL